MSRTAESTIKGFLYQFQKTIKEILTAPFDSSITVEGIVEDVDIDHIDGSTTAIQCKYHESVDNFTPSLIYKPLLQMAEHYSSNTSSDINYRLYVHVPGNQNTNRSITIQELDAALASTNRSLKSIIERIPSVFSKQDFLSKLTLEFGPSIDSLGDEIKTTLSNLSIANSDVESILYPNAINHIARMSCNDTVQDRTITRRSFEEMLSNCNSTAISRWTLALKNKKQLLLSKRKQLLNNLSQNTRERCIYISKDQIPEFNDKIVVFICNFIAKYHVKALHTKSPIFAFDCNKDELDNITFRLHKKDITARTGFIGGQFDLTNLYQPPVQPGTRSLPCDREFQVRLVSTTCTPHALNHRKCDDLFFVSRNRPQEVDYTDIETADIEVPNFSELEYVLSMRNDYE